MRQSSYNPLDGSGDQNPTERENRAALYDQRAVEFAPRQRWQAAAIRFMLYLYQGMLTPSASGNDGMTYTVPAHLWAAERAEELFDNGGCLEVRTGQLAVPRGPKQTEGAAIILVNGHHLRTLIAAINRDEILRAPPVDPSRTESAGRPSLRRAIDAEFRRRFEAGETETTIKAQGEALHKWADEAYPRQATPSSRVIETHIRSSYNTLVRRPK